VTQPVDYTEVVDFRIVGGGVTKSQWPAYMKELYRILRPGSGWIQCGEFDPLLRCDDNSIPADASLWKVGTLRELEGNSSFKIV
jgi:hypothetical protein